MLNPSHPRPLLEQLLNQRVNVEISTDTRFRVATGCDRNYIIDAINSVAGERKYLQTDRYCSTPTWESLLSQGANIESGLLLLIVENLESIIGFARLNPDRELSGARKAGNVGIALLRSYRARGIGAIILRTLIACAIEMDYDVLTANILESNLRSRSLFSKCGFRQVACRDIFLDFLADQVNELYYKVELSALREAKQSDF